MKIRTIITAGAGAAGLIAAGALSAASPALAASACTGPSCNETGSIVVTASISETLTPDSFSFAPVVAGQQSGPRDNNGNDYTGAFMSNPPPVLGALSPDYHVVVTTGDASGYSLAGSGTAFTAGSNSFPLSALSSWYVFGSTTWQPFSLTGTPHAIATSATASGGTGDDYAFNDAVQVPSTAGNGTYSAVITYAAVAN